MLWLAAQDFDARLPGATSVESLLYVTWLSVDLILLVRWSVHR